MKYIFVLLMLPLVCIGEEYQWADTCNRDQRSMNTCAGEMFKFYDQQLNALYSKQMKHLQTSSRKTALKKSQRAWIEFRDLDCLYEAGKREDSGSIWPLIHNSCLADRTKTRVKELRAFVACRDNGCPY